MGDITLARLPDYLDRWGIRYEIEGDWLNVGRKSGGFDQIMGVIIHHSASARNGSLAASVRYNLSAVTAPIGNGILSRDKDGPKVVLYAALASNTAGRGGPMLSSRGVIPQDAGNRLTINWEAENNGTNEPWSDAMSDMYVKLCCASLQWANENTPGAPLGPGDVWAHREWAPTRKVDPRGPSRFSGDDIVWEMDRFRGEVFARLVEGAPAVPPMATGVPVPTIAPAQTGPEVGNLQDVLRFWGWLPCEDEPWVYGGCTVEGVGKMQTVLGAPVTGTYDVPTARAYSEFILAMQAISCQMPAESHLGSSGPEVVKLQEFLNSNNWYMAEIDGEYGQLTEQGVQKMQVYAKQQMVYVGPIHGQYDTATREAVCRII
jgi:hypothetical protein